MDLTVLVPVYTATQRAQRIFWHLAGHPPAQAFEVLVLDYTPAGFHTDWLNQFRSTFRWRLVEQGGAVRLGSLVTGDRVLCLPGYALPAAGALQGLLDSHRTFAPCRRAGVLLAEGLDEWGSNLTPAMLQDCEASDSHIAIQPRSDWGLPAVHAEVAETAPFVLYLAAATPPRWPTPDAMVAVVRGNY